MRVATLLTVSALALLVMILPRPVTAVTAFHAEATTDTALTGGDLAYVTLSSSDLVALVDTASHTVVGTVNVGSAGCDFPWRAAMSPDGAFVYVSCYNSGTVALIETAGNTVATTIAGIPYADGIAFTHDGAYALVGSRHNYQIVVVDMATHFISYLPTPDEPRSIVAHPYLDRAYATCADGTILVIDTAAWSIVTSIPVGTEPWDVAISPNGQWLFAGDRWGWGLAVIDTTSDALHTTVTGLDYLTGLDVAPDGSEVYASGLAGGVHVVDALTFQLITTVPGNDEAWEVAVTCDGSELYVGDTSNQLPVIGTASHSVIQSIPLPGYGARGIAICPQNAASGASLIPSEQTNDGARGEVVAHQEILVNLTGTTDSFDLALDSHVWETALSTDSLGPIAEGDSATFTVYVTVPVGIDWYSTDTVVIAATSVTSPTVYSDTAEITTRAYAPPEIGVSPDSLSSTQYVNETTSANLALSNGNGVTLTFSIDDGERTSAQIQTSQYYTTTEDNEDNAYSGYPDGDMDVSLCGGYPLEPIEFNIFVDTSAGSIGNLLTIRTYDVDSPDEVDEVRLNGVYLGDLSGADDTWSETTFEIPAGTMVSGANLVEIDITSSDWCVTVDWGRLFLVGRPVPWLDETPASGSLPSNSSQDISVTFDATGLQPKEYRAYVWVNSNDPVLPSMSLPMTMTVLPTASMGWVEGTVSDAGSAEPLEATLVALGQPYSTNADAETGHYVLWLDAGSYTLQASAKGYVTATASVDIVAQKGATQDLSLILDVPVLQVGHEEMQVSQQVGESASRVMTIANAGPADLMFDLTERDTTSGLVLLEEYARTEQEMAEIAAQVTSTTGPDNEGVPTVARFPAEAFLHLQGTTRILAWTTYVDYDEEYENTLNAIAQYTTYSLVETTTTDPATLKALLAGADLFLLPEQEGSDYSTLYAIGSSWSSVLADFVTTGGTVVALDDCNNTTGLIEGAGLMDLTVGSCTGSTTVEVVEPDHPLVQGLPATFSGRNGTGYYTSTNGQQIVRVYGSSSTVVAAREVGVGHVVMIGFDFYEYNAEMARLLANAVQWYNPDVPWLSLAPISGLVPGYGSAPVQVTFDAAGLQPGDYTADAIVRSNDPVLPAVSVPVSMTVLPAAGMGQVAGMVYDDWTGLPLTATVELAGVYSMMANPDYGIWAPAGTYSLSGYAPGYYTSTLSVPILAGETVVEDVALEPALPRLEWTPNVLTATAIKGTTVAGTMTLFSTGPMPLEFTVHEISPAVTMQALSPADLSGSQILYDRAHGEPGPASYNVLIDDVVAAGAVVTENWYLPMDANVLEGYDVLWINCCGTTAWGFGELNAISDWLAEGGALFVHGESSPTTTGPASIFGINYQSGYCNSGSTANIDEHPISKGVGSFYVEYTCSLLLPGSGAEIVVFDSHDQPHVVAQEQGGGKMVVVASQDLLDGYINYDDNRLLANNILAWLARPAYSDVPWLAASPQAGTIPGHGLAAIGLEFDATNLPPGSYQAILAIEHNDPAQPSPIELPVKLTVRTGPRQIYLPLALRHDG
ncbi:MAG: hypothetical protein P8129_00460 [Anaerolineae bacterium]